MGARARTSSAPGSFPAHGDADDVRRTRTTTSAGWREALAEARLALEHDDVPIGAVVVRGGHVVGRGHNEREVRKDPTAHAEIIAMQRAAAASCTPGGCSTPSCT